VQDSSLCS